MFSVFSEIVDFLLVNSAFVSTCDSFPVPRPGQDPLRHKGPPPPQCCHLLPMFDNVASNPREDKYLVYHLIFCIIHAVLNVH